jgi:hypothetical protein
MELLLQTGGKCNGQGFNTFTVTWRGPDGNQLTPDHGFRGTFSLMTKKMPGLISIMKAQEKRSV